MNFIKIYKRSSGEEFGDIRLDLVVDQRNLTKKEADDLYDYFEDNTFMEQRTYAFKNTLTFEITNKDELLENSPLPDGTIVLDRKFTEDGQYLVVIGNTNDRDDIKIGVTL